MPATQAQHPGAGAEAAVVHLQVEAAKRLGDPAPELGFGLVDGPGVRRHQRRQRVELSGRPGLLVFGRAAQHDGLIALRRPEEALGALGVCSRPQEQLVAVLARGDQQTYGVDDFTRTHARQI